MLGVMVVMVFGRFSHVGVTGTPDSQIPGFDGKNRIQYGPFWYEAMVETLWTDWNSGTLELKQKILVKGKIWGVPLGGYPSSCSPNITPYCPIQPLFNPYIGGICWYISGTLP